MDLTVARNFMVALLIGALIGIEREKKRDAEPGRSLGGIRTHILLSLLGAASAWLARELSMGWVFVVALAVVGGAVVTSYVMQNRRSHDAPALTSEIAAIAVYLLGGMAVTGNSALAVALAVTMSAVLAYKQPLHILVDRIGLDDIYAGIKLLIATFIILPLLPDAPVDPLGALNPYKIWLLVILISALSLVGYLAMRWLGTADGTAITGITGGLVSSTATTLSLARASANAADPAHSSAVVAGILLAWLVMFLRVLALVALINMKLLHSVWMPIAVMSVATAAFAFRHYRAGRASSMLKAGERVVLANPFSLSAAVRFGALFAAVLMVLKLAQNHLPGIGLYLVSALAGSIDIDAITVSIAKDAGASIVLPTAGVAIALAAMTSTVVKCALVAAAGTGPVRRSIAIATFLIIAGGMLTSWLT